MTVSVEVSALVDKYNIIWHITLKYMHVLRYPLPNRRQLY